MLGFACVLSRPKPREDEVRGWLLASIPLGTLLSSRAAVQLDDEPSLYPWLKRESGHGDKAERVRGAGSLMDDARTVQELPGEALGRPGGQLLRVAEGDVGLAYSSPWCKCRAPSSDRER